MEFHVAGGHVSKINLRWNHLTGKIPRQLGKLRELEVLKLHNNQLCGEIPPALKNLSSIPLPDQGRTYLNLDYNHLTASDPKLIAWLRKHNRSWDTTQTPCSGTSCVEVTEIPTPECKALVKFYNSTGGDQWDDNTGWHKTQTPCNWYGVTCQSGHVKKLELSSNQLSGFLPKKIARLKELQTLDLSYNQLEGFISTLEKLENLKTLLLNNNEFRG
jgi:Leucine-rich repeat (LRR) protein